MVVVAFRIFNFRSIVDSGWIKFSPDGITVLVGQNESGKTSVLEALHVALGYTNPTEDDFRTGAPLPIVSLRIQLDADKLEDELTGASEGTIRAMRSYLANTHNLAEIDCTWGLDEANKIVAYATSKDRLLAEMVIDESSKDNKSSEEELEESEQEASEGTEFDSSQASLGTPKLPVGELTAPEKEESVAIQLWRELPVTIFFNEESGRLPNEVDIDSKGSPTGTGAKAARNYLRVAGIDLPNLLKGDRRSQENTLNRANSKVSEDFNNFWTQTIGKSGKLSLKCAIDNYPTTSDKAGKPHLVFWICDGNTQLYPKQRSQGVRWFVSFYLQLKASEKAKQVRIFLLDEPGANLHSKAQGDVLKLINKLAKNTSTVVYSTHSPQLLEYDRLFRVHAVQRDGDEDDSPSKVIDAHRLGTASTDTLSPILTAMGADLSQHQVIKRTNNVLLEEMSGFYYLNSLWKLSGRNTPAHFIAATGVNKIEALANMFTGWGLKFIVAVDDDKQGREAFKSLKRELFGDSEDVAKQHLMKISSHAGIEDIFSTDDFRSFVLHDKSAAIQGKNSEYIKQASLSKPVLAFNFSLSIDKGELKWQDFSAETRANLDKVLGDIEIRLKSLAV